MQHILGKDRNQLQFISLEQLVPDDSWARLVDLFVDLLPLGELGFKHSDLQKEGRPPYNPSTLLKLYLYGYKHSIRSSRKLEHSCKVNVELWWLLKGLTPSFRTIAYFRKENSIAFKSAFKRFVLILKDLDLIEGETIAIDSFKIFAQNSIRNNYSQKKIDRHLDYIDKKVEEYENQLNQADAQEKEMLKKKIATKLIRREKYQALNKELKDSNDTQISLTDKEARFLRMTNYISGVGYNVQAASDAKNKLLVYSHIGATTDQRALEPAVLDIKGLLNIKTFNLLSDAGYTTADQLHLCKKAGICTYSSPVPCPSSRNNCFLRSAFTYNKEEDYYICPSGEKMTCAPVRSGEDPNKSKLYKTKACLRCTIRKRCTHSKTWTRIIERGVHQDEVDENTRRVVENPDYYKLRRAIIEHPFGTLKRHWGFTFTLMRGKKNVMSEVNILMIIYNLRRCMSIMGEKVLMERLKSLFAHYLSHFRRFYDSISSEKYSLGFINF